MEQEQPSTTAVRLKKTVPIATTLEMAPAIQIPEALLHVTDPVGTHESFVPTECKSSSACLVGDTTQHLDTNAPMGEMRHWMMQDTPRLRILCHQF